MFFSRQRWQEKCKAIENELEEKDRELKSISGELKKRDDLIASQASRIRELQETLTAAKADQTSVRLPDDPPLYQHQYGKRMISLSVNLAARIGLRAAERVLRIVFDWLGVQCDIPTWQSIRGWMQRVGLARMTKQPKQGEELHWLVDHSVQVGKEKVLAVVGVSPAATQECPEAPVRNTTNPRSKGNPFPRIVSNGGLVPKAGRGFGDLR